ncbi:MAG: hypothetical protein KDJ35_08970 [Alphaproteobacteria bacterium]|nr:hypothetical protein [Alphaproteobacteria bacterium]
MISQSTRHIMMMEPAEFYANPETMETNVYQVTEDLSKDEIFQKALIEFRAYRDMLVENGVIVTTAYGYKGCPDMIFPNWVSTHEGGRMVIYPMLNDNRRAERDPAVIDFLKKAYPQIIDMTAYEQEGKFLEARGSIVSDRVNKIGYAALSARTNEELARKWAQEMGYEIEVFDTLSHTGKPVYHTDLVMYVGSTMAAVCAPAIVEKDRARILDRLSATHEVMELSMEQLTSFCGNALEVRGAGDEKMLAMSSAAHAALSEDQKEFLSKHFAKLLHSPLPTLEKYGGGSARCTLLELY